VLNVLQEGQYKNLLRHFCAASPPGADRFEGVPRLGRGRQGGPCLSDALAFLGCPGGASR